MDYRKDYWSIAFRVIYSLDVNMPNMIVFAAQPFEKLTRDRFRNDPSKYMLYGRVQKGGQLEIGLRGFTIEMNEELHRRLGLLYEIVFLEYYKVILRKK